MLVYNIRSQKYSASLTASGVANRWNKKDEFVIYAAQSISLATLELLVHKNSIHQEITYKSLTIQISDNNSIEIFDKKLLPKDWKSLNSYSILQNFGSLWYQSRRSLVLQIPSVIIPQEFNYIINTLHPEFTSKIELLNIEDFLWDDRLINV
jgi:RES domain-containing protein